MIKLQQRINKIADNGILSIKGYQPFRMRMIWQVTYFGKGAKYKRVSGMFLDKLIEAIEYYILNYSKGGEIMGCKKGKGKKK